MAPSSTPKPSEAVPQQISPQAQPQLQEIAACLAKNYWSLLNQAQQPSRVFVNGVESVVSSGNTSNSQHPPANPQKNTELYTMAAMAAAATTVVPTPFKLSEHFSPQPQSLPANFWWMNPHFLEDVRYFLLISVYLSSCYQNKGRVSIVCLRDLVFSKFY